MISAYGGVLMHDLGTSLSIEDCHDLLEVAAVDAHNRRVMNKRR